MLKELIKCCTHSEAHVRERACQFLQTLFPGLQQDLGNNEIIADLKDVLIQRLSDRDAKVRCAATYALCNLLGMIQDGMDSEPISHLLNALDCERSLGVRVAIISNLPLTEGTTSSVLERTLDTSQEVRCATYLKLRQRPLQTLLMEHKVLLVMRGLRDRTSSVQDAAQTLVVHWLKQDCESDLLQLIGMLEPELNCDAVELVFKALVSAGAVEPLALLKQEAAQLGHGFVKMLSPNQPNQPGKACHISSAQAMFWWLLCSSAHKNASERSSEAASTSGAAAGALAAQAAAFYEALDLFVRDSASGICNAILLLVAQGGNASFFSAIKLLELAGACMDWADRANCDIALGALESLIVSPQHRGCEQTTRTGKGPQPVSMGGDGSWEMALVRFMKAVQGNDESCLMFYLGILDKAKEAWGLVVSDGGPRDVEENMRILPYLAHGLHALHLAALSTSCMEQSLKELMSVVVQSTSFSSLVIVRTLQAQCFAAAGLVPCLRHKLPSVMSYLSETFSDAAEASVVKVQAIQGLGNLVLVHGVRAVDKAAAVRSESWDLLSSCEREVVGLDLAADQLSKVTLDSAKGCNQERQDERQLERSLPPHQDCIVLKMRKLLSNLCGVATTDKSRKGFKALDEGCIVITAALTETLARLMLHQELQLQMSIRTQQCLHIPDDIAQQVLAQLLVLQVHPATEIMPPIRQLLTAFFEDFVKRSIVNKRRLCDCAMLAIQAASGLGGSKVPPAVQVVKYISQLLEEPSREAGIDHEDAVVPAGAGSMHELAMRVLLRLSHPEGHDAASGVKRLEVQRELSKLLLSLAPSISESQSVKACLVLLERCSSVISDSATLVHLRAFRKQLEDIDEPGEVGIPEEDLRDMIERISKQCPLEQHNDVVSDCHDQDQGSKMSTRSQRPRC
ncbi:hypothetical protein CEUSTIGMA_g2169.t1 [Chlamydomonas eustigma]|uniref:Nuclear condensin complex subunit 3 C-terminal domain-containing protein n=1 Tax=Chlamydomonas eustigma TaxID=1157962 RepID=A0A250WVS1_9CHLO|nr:hypothetical protein CEUSTIGMA_g2169.t1 [Chlamydomonas eustigma]|eukprot:GAX74722.1 hypothetical protein CEUSTIGMA_g2169.t1 [Chlamydomonas eustigma]